MRKQTGEIKRYRRHKLMYTIDRRESKRRESKRKNTETAETISYSIFVAYCCIFYKYSYESRFYNSMTL